MKEQQDKNFIERPPVVVIMGHIDHGKSTLLDYIRHSNVVENEAGKITQHLGAYEVEHKNEKEEIKRITFIDTPGHEAFKSVRSRGSKVADIAILIVSAEDGVMPQTLEALECIKKDNVPFIVAINKIDTPKANPENTKNSLIENEIYIEGYGGNVPAVEISAKTGQNVGDLLDLILLLAEVEELKANPDVLGEGVIVEANKDDKKGISATLVIKNGTIRQRQFVVCNDAISPVRIMENHLGELISEASFSTPVNIKGWNKLPAVGETFYTFENKKEAEKYCLEHQNKNNQKNDTSVDSEESFVVPVIIKADTQGSLDAIAYELSKIDLPNTKIKIIDSDTGNISEADIKKASGHENTVVVGFGVNVDKQAVMMKDRMEVTVETFNIIYELTQWLENNVENIRPRIKVEELVGVAKILKTFNRDKNKQVVGAKVSEGILSVGNKIKIIRREEEVGSGVIKGLQQQKNIAESVSEGTEFGASIDARIDIAPGDQIKSFEILEK